MAKGLAFVICGFALIGFTLIGMLVAQWWCEKVQKRSFSEWMRSADGGFSNKRRRNGT
jgi:hypothetical protein